MKSKIALLILTLFSIQACQSALVLPRSDGSFEIRSKASTRQQALEFALDGAKDTCKKQGRSYIVERNDLFYRGALDENSKNLINQLNNIAAATSLLSSKSGSKSIALPNNPASTSEDYEAVLNIRCQGN